MAERISIGGAGTASDRIGEAAGRVWRQLRAHGPQNPAALAKATGRPEHEIHQALGWLARENKLRADGDRFTLVEHEMKIAM